MSRLKRLRSLAAALSVATLVGLALTSAPAAQASALQTFTLPAPQGTLPQMSYNLQTDFPQVDWSRMDRLYIPAYSYASIVLKGLPTRPASRPLVITNSGGQVKVGGAADSKNIVIGGGSNWILTGRYDPAAATGNIHFPGHAGDNYAHSQGRYGITVDDNFSRTGILGLSVAEGATDFELDMIEVTRVEFAGVVLKTDNNGTATMRNVKVHDLYIHDTGSEGMYIGSTQPQPQHTFENLKIYNNRVLRTGSEAIQLGQQGNGVEVHHNVIGPAAIRWRSAFAQYQDNNIQWGQRYGSGSFHHNVVIGAGDQLLQYFPTTVPGDPWQASDTVTFHDNYFADTSRGGIYTHNGGTGVTLKFINNTFGGFNFTYNEVYPVAGPPNEIFGTGSSAMPHVFTNTTIDGPYPLQAAPRTNVTEQNTVLTAVPRVQFRNFMTSDLASDYRKVEWWTDRMTLHPQQLPMVYEIGDYVMHGGVLYRALAQNQEIRPDLNPQIWQALPAPADDVRLVPGSAQADRGVGLMSGCSPRTFPHRPRGR